MTVGQLREVLLKFDQDSEVMPFAGYDHGQTSPAEIVAEHPDGDVWICAEEPLWVSKQIFGPVHTEHAE